MKNNLTGSYHLFVYHGSKYTTYSIRIATKNEDGSYQDAYLNVSFTEASGYKKWNAHDSRYKIDIEESWLKAIQKKSGESAIIVMINKCTVTPIEEKNPPKEETKKPFNDLPF